MKKAEGKLRLKSGLLKFNAKPTRFGKEGFEADNLDEAEIKTHLNNIEALLKEAARRTQKDRGKEEKA
ncbi:hypothetical protein KEJ27_10170 [Candidatus Bathyarchaeota archaeon]|nr:hypothetical protein [Candidatus Brockarchaeota archaeon]MBS7612542.1 hypothetical protein [Candidatus Bathyarchaeota archaeon]